MEFIIKRPIEMDGEKITFPPAYVETKNCKQCGLLFQGKSELCPIDRHTKKESRQREYYHTHKEAYAVRHNRRREKLRDKRRMEKFSADC